MASVTRSKKRSIDEINPNYDEKPRVSKRLKLEPKRIVTWNLQGAGGDAAKPAEVRRLMGVPGIDAICLQECGDLYNWNDDDLPFGWKIAKHRNWNAGGGNNRCSLAILARSGAHRTKTIEATWDQGRPMIGAKIDGGIWVWCVHAPHHSPNYVLSAVGAARLNSSDSGKWICAGDFNLEPGNAMPCDGAAVVNCGNKTHQGGLELDYAFVSTSHAMRQNTLRGNALISDHFWVEFWLNNR
ncbi:endonuclease/exonuclease/phosphatase family protein [Pelagibius sp. Alg239-R121]|uniref:endonuclease/exonuclease/phosphatase family protein n=1 Tax=Pelagibius sp. Alg239-R121 TaxID=2993448 RepID=UPI0024A672FC|nr:endonuclease/exonuclease/phosphatase family protein [Pelagibius sp. Alg239-R121]